MRRRNYDKLYDEMDPSQRREVGRDEYGNRRRVRYVDVRKDSSYKVKTHAGRYLMISALMCVVVAGGILYNQHQQAQRPVEVPTEQEAPVEPAAPAEESISQHLTVGLKGSAVQLVRAGDPYVEAGAYAIDSRTGPITDVEMTGASEIDTGKPGDYPVTYTFRTDDGIGTVERTVRVVAADDFVAATDGVPVLMYHFVYTASDVPESLDGNWILDTDLAAQLQYLQESDYYYPSFAELRAYVQGEIALPERSIVLTFDDGNQKFLAYGLPLLEQYQVPATSFLVGAYGDTEQVKTWPSAYVCYQSHSYDMHRPGGSVGHGGIISAMTREEILQDLNQSIAMTGNHDAFAYPFGDYTDDAMGAVEDSGILCAFSTEHGKCRPGDNPACLPRIRAQGAASLEAFIGSIS